MLFVLSHPYEQFQFISTFISRKFQVNKKLMLFPKIADSLYIFSFNTDMTALLCLKISKQVATEGLSTDSLQIGQTPWRNY